MRMTKFVMSVLAGVMITSAAWADPIATPYWELTYDTDASWLEISSPIGVLTADLGPGSMTVQRSPDGNGGPARLAQYYLRWDFNLSGVNTNMDTWMEGDANGAWNVNVLQINWSTPADGWRSQGSLMCTGGELICGFAGLPENVPIPTNTVGDEPIGDLQYAGSDALMTWVLAPDPSGSVKTIHVIGARTGVTWVDTPEPMSGALVAFGLAGILIARSRKS